MDGGCEKVGQRGKGGTGAGESWGGSGREGGGVRHR